MGRYKRPRRLNWVTALSLLAVAGGIYGLVKFGPAFRMRWQATEIVGKGVYKLFSFKHHTGALRGEEERALREEIVRKLHGIGVSDPDLAVTIDQTQSRLTVSAEFAVEVRHPWTTAPTRIRFHPSASTSTERPFQ